VCYSKYSAGQQTPVGPEEIEAHGITEIYQTKA
jgi:hypothetical protein